MPCSPCVNHDVACLCDLIKHVRPDNSATSNNFSRFAASWPEAHILQCLTLAGIELLLWEA